MVGKSTHLQVIPQQRTTHPKRSKFAITDVREKPVKFFFLFNASVDFSLRNNFAKSGSLAKVSVFVHNYIK